MLKDKISGSQMKPRLPFPEYLRVVGGTWWGGLFSEGDDTPSIQAMRTVGKSARCVNRVRNKDSLCGLGFLLVNGLTVLATDGIAHRILDGPFRTMGISSPH